MKSLVLLILSFILINTFAQNVGIGTNNPNTEAKLDIASTNSGLLIPRMTSTQRLSIADETVLNTTANGMLIYDITLNKLMIFDSTANSNNGKWYVLEPTVNVWKTQGNSGTNAATNFIGTTDSVDLVFKNKNNQNMRLFADGSWLVGDSIQWAGDKTFFSASRVAFRTGSTNLSVRSWDKDSLGFYSFAAGYNLKGTGPISFAAGGNNEARGEGSIVAGQFNYSNGYGSAAFGVNSRALHRYSGSIGFNTSATAEASIALNNTTTANGNNSTAMGKGSVANGFSSLVIGQYNDPVVTPEILSISSTTPIFIIGNGTSPTAKSNAMLVRYDGNVGIGTNTPATNLDVNGTTKTTNFQMTTGAGANKILQSDASGNASWITPVDMNTDSQSLNLSGTTLSISRGNSVNLNSIETDPQVASTTNYYIPKWLNTSLIDGSIKDSSTYIGIGTNPIGGQALTVNGMTATTLLKVTTGAGSGKILQSDINGVATWVTPTYIDTDTQSLSLTGTNLTISRGNTIDLSSIETDPQVSSATSNRIPRWNGTTLVDGLIQDDATNIGIGTAPISGQKLSVNGKTTTQNFQMLAGAAANKILQSDASGNASWVTPTDMDTDTQSLSLTGTNLTLSRGNTIDLSSIETDPQVSAANNNRIPRWNGTSLVDGLIQDDASNIGIGIAPVSGQKLSINGKTTTTNFQLTNNAAKDKWLKSDSLGNAIWDSLDAAKVNAWGITGNTNTNPLTNFIGTADSTGLNISTNNQSRLNIGAFGTLGLKTNSIVSRGINQQFTPKTLDSNNYAIYQDMNIIGNGTGSGLKSQYGRYLNMNVSNTSSFPLGFIFGDYMNINLSDISETTNYYGAYGQYINLVNNGKNNGSPLPSINGSNIEVNVNNDSITSSILGTFVRAQSTGTKSPNRITGSTIYSINETIDTISTLLGLNLGIYLGQTGLSAAKGKTNDIIGVNNTAYIRDNHTIQNYYNIKNDIFTGGLLAGGTRINNLYGYHLDISTYDLNDKIDTVKAFYANFDYTTNKRYGLYISGEGYNFLSGNLGLGVLTPSSKLEVNGNTKTTNFQMTTGAGTNKILQSDASGNASWITPIDMNTDSQSLNLTGTTLSISRGNSINLSSINSDTQSLNLTGTTLSISRGNSINLSSIETDPQVSSSTINQIPKWNGTTLVDGIITDNTTAVGIGMMPVSRLDISNGNLRVSGLGNTDTSADNNGTGGAIIWNNSNGIGGGVARKVERMTKGQVAVAANSTVNFYDDPFLQFRIIRNGSGAGSTIYLEIAPKTGATGDYSISTTDGSISTFITAATVGTFTNVVLDLRNADAAKEFSISKRGGNNQAVYRIIIHKNSGNTGINPEAFNISTEAYY